MNSTQKTPPLGGLTSRHPSLRAGLALLSAAALIAWGCGPKSEPQATPEPEANEPPAIEAVADFGERGSVEFLGFVKASDEGPRATDTAGNYLQGAGEPRMVQAINTVLQISPMPDLVAVFAVEETNANLSLRTDSTIDADWFEGDVILHILWDGNLPKELTYTVTASWTDESDPVGRFRLRGSEIEPITQNSPCQVSLEAMAGNLTQIVAECAFEPENDEDSLTFALVAPNGDRSDGTTIPGSQMRAGQPVRLILPLSANAIGEAVILRSRTEEKKLTIPLPEFD